KVDSLMNVAVSSGMTAGRQILVARDGKVVYNKNFGKTAYGESGDEIQDDHIYDLASLTKITATLPLLIQLSEKGEISFDSTLGELIPELRDSNKSDLKYVDVLTHYARLTAWIPFYLETIGESSKLPLEKYYRNEPSRKFSVKVADDLYMREDYKDSIFKIIKDSELLPRLEYRYSDLAFLIMQRYIENYYNNPLDKVANEHFYASLGMNHTSFNPLEKFRKGMIVPSEVDNYFRHQTIQGYVHDMAAAMLGGV